MGYSNDPIAHTYANVPSPLPNIIEFPTPFWITKLMNMAMVGCLNPDLVFAELAAGAAAKLMWNVATPSIKQMIEGATGRSWICGTKQVMGGVKEGEQIASSGTGRFIYGAVKGLDIMAYYAFMVSVGGQGVADFIGFAARFIRKCNGDQSQWRGIDPLGGWPSDTGGKMLGPQWQTPLGDRAGPFLYLNRGEIGCIVAWCSFSNLEGNGGVITRMTIEDFLTGEVFDSCTCNNMFNTHNMAVVQWFTNEGRIDRDRILVIRVEFLASVTARAIPVKGGCYIRSWIPGAGNAPPIWNMKQHLAMKPK
jgi:hypothetical protein